jgi:anti-anti-sigma regulatory factor
MGLFAVDVLARLHLATRRRGVELRIAAPPELRDLIAFCGLDEVLRIELQRQPEEREERDRVEEERELLDPGV